jgi:phosphopantothenoylcysteine synthetase/decarboxylase
LRRKRILITGGPTWVALDAVRVISNISSGETVRLLAGQLADLGLKVDLLLGPVEGCCINKKIRLIRFLFFRDLKKLLRQRLRQSRYDIIIHAAAVSDFAPAKVRKDKIPSGRGISLKLKPLPKLSRLIRRLNPRARLVLFKLEAGLSDKGLIRLAKKSAEVLGAETMVANRLNPYRAFIIQAGSVVACAASKSGLVSELIKHLNLKDK